MEPMQIIAWMEGLPLMFGLTVIGLSAAIEYVFPPFPGDTVTLVGAVLVGTGGWPWWGVVLAILLGSAAGIAIDWRAGVWIEEAERKTWLHDFLAREKTAKAIERVKGKFREHGSMYIMANRFLPAFRSVFFLVSGMARLSLGKVLFYGVISVALWTALIFALGVTLGYHLDTIAVWISRYSMVLWAVFIAWIAWMVWRNFFRKGSSSDQGDGIA